MPGRNCPFWCNLRAATPPPRHPAAVGATTLRPQPSPAIAWTASFASLVTISSITLPDTRR